MTEEKTIEWIIKEYDEIEKKATDLVEPIIERIDKDDKETILETVDSITKVVSLKKLEILAEYLDVRPGTLELLRK